MACIKILQIEGQDARMAELGIEQTQRLRLAIDLEQVESMWESVHEGMSVINMRSGDEYQVVVDFDYILGEWTKAIS